MRLPRPHAKQRQFLNSDAKRRVVVAGRRVGKTTGVSILATQAMLAGRRVLEAAPVADQTGAFWDACKSYLAPMIQGGLVRKNETERLLELGSNGGRIRCKTAWDADSLRGDYADLLILDEYSLMDPSAWDQVGAPMLLDNDGDAVFIFTPKRRNHAFAMYQRAIADESGRWRAWHFTSHDNPYLSHSALAEITADMTEDAYRQEILAEFLENEGAVFRNIGACIHAPATTPEEHAGHDLVLGADWAQTQDFTAFSVVCATCRREVARDRMQTIEYPEQRQRLVALANRWHVGRILAEQNSIGRPNLQDLQRMPELARCGIEGFETTATTKPPLIESLKLALENVECQWQADPIWTGELEAYEVKYNANTGRPTYSAPEGVHDDTVIARALAWSLVVGGGPLLLWGN